MLQAQLIPAINPAEAGHFLSTYKEGHYKGAQPNPAAATRGNAKRSFFQGAAAEGIAVNSGALGGGAGKKARRAAED